MTVCPVNSENCAGRSVKPDRVRARRRLDHGERRRMRPAAVAEIDVGAHAAQDDAALRVARQRAQLHRARRVGEVHDHALGARQRPRQRDHGLRLLAADDGDVDRLDGRDLAVGEAGVDADGELDVLAAEALAAATGRCDDERETDDPPH